MEIDVYKISFVVNHYSEPYSIDLDYDKRLHTCKLSHPTPEQVPAPFVPRKYARKY